MVTCSCTAGPPSASSTGRPCSRRCTPPWHLPWPALYRGSARKWGGDSVATARGGNPAGLSPRGTGPKRLLNSRAAPRSSSPHAESKTSGGRKPSKPLGTTATRFASLYEGRMAGALSRCCSENGGDQPRVTSKLHVPRGRWPPLPVSSCSPSTCVTVTSSPPSRRPTTAPWRTSALTVHGVSGSDTSTRPPGSIAESGALIAQRLAERCVKPSPRVRTRAVTRLPEASAPMSAVKEAPTPVHVSR